MTKKFLTAVGLLILTLLIITGCNKQIVAEYELANDTTVRLYSDGTFVYEQLNVIKEVEGNNQYANQSDYNYPAVTGHVTRTETKIYIGKYKKTSNSTYTLNLSEMKLKYDLEHDFDPAEEMMYLSNQYKNIIQDRLETYWFRKFPQYEKQLTEIMQGKGEVSFQLLSGYEIEIELNKNGRVAKHLYKYPQEFVFALHTGSYYYDDYIYTYDENGELAYYIHSDGNIINSDNNSNQYYMKYNKYNDKLGSADTETPLYEYTYYDDGTIKSSIGASYKYEYYPNGTPHFVYHYVNKQVSEIREYDENYNLINYSSGNIGYSPTLKHSYEYNDDGTIKTYNSKNYTYNIERYSNGVIKFAETYIDGEINTRIEFYNSGVIKATYKYHNGAVNRAELYNENGIKTELKSVAGEGYSTYIVKYDPLTGHETEKYERASSDEEFKVTNSYEEIYDAKTDTTTFNFYRYFDEDTKLLTYVYVFNKDFEPISVVEYDYDGGYTDPWVTKAKIMDDGTLIWEMYDDSNNELFITIYYEINKGNINIHTKLANPDLKP